MNGARVLGRFVTALCVLLGCVPAAAQEMPVPIETQAPIFLKVTTFEKRIADAKGRDFVLGVVFQSGYRLSVAARGKFIEIAGREASSGPAGRLLRIVPLDLDGKESLDAMIRRTGVAAVWVAPLRAFDVAEIAAATRSNGVLSLTGVPAYVESGLSITLVLNRERPRIVVNLEAARAEGAELAAALLNLATVFQGGEAPMSRARDLSVKTRLTLLSAVVAAALAAGVFLVVPPMVERHLLDGITADTVGLTQMISGVVSAPVFFGDARAAQDLLDGLSRDKDVLYAVARLRDGSPLATYRLPGGLAPPKGPLGREFWISDDGLLLRTETPVVANGQVVGSVDLCESLHGLRQEVARSRRNLAWLSLLLFAASTAAAYWISSFVLRPLRGLAGTADKVARGDLTQRAVVRGRNEFGRLATVFNRMVESLESAQGGLEFANRDLESRVDRRTQELEEEIVRRQRVEEALTESEHRYRSLFEENLSGSFLCRPDGELLACNPAFAHMFGFASPGDALRERLFSLFPDAQSATQILDALREHGRVRNVELDMLQKDGRSVRVIGSFVGTFERHELREIQGHLFDTTERRSLEDQLRQAQKMEAIGRLAGGVAHDFNNLLTVILGFSDLVLSKVGPADENASDLEEIHRAGERAAALTKQLLAFSRRQVLEPTVLDVNAVLHAMSGMLGRLIGEDINLVTRFAPDLGSVRADAGQLEQVIVNLAVNARDSMPKGGKLVIETRNQDVDDAHAGGALHRPAGPCVVLEVSDSGAGMDKETLAHLFEPFFTTKEQGKGTGLGLATVYGIVQQSGGVVDVSSTPGHGSSFRIFLPRVAGEAGAPGAAEKKKHSTQGTETILVAEDEHAVRRLTRIALEAAGYEVLEAVDGAAALDLLIRTDRPVSLLLTDVVMPGLNGPDTAARAVRLRPGLKVLFMSGYADPEVATRGVTEAGWPLLRKPFASPKLTESVRRALDGRTAVGESGTWGRPRD